VPGSRKDQDGACEARPWNPPCPSFVTLEKLETLNIATVGSMHGDLRATGRSSKVKIFCNWMLRYWENLLLV
jgi:hypothetical protein